MKDQLRGLRDPFITPTGAEIMGPPAHPQCRCAQGLVTKPTPEQIDESQEIGGSPIDQTVQDFNLSDDDILALPSSAYRPAIANAPDTATAFMPGGIPTLERQRLHDAIIRKELLGFVGVDEPLVTVLGGGPASGKSTVVKAIGAAPNTKTIDVDHIRTLFPEYGEGISASNAAISAQTHEEATFLTRRLAREAGQSRYNMVFDGTGDGSYENLASKLQSFRDNGAKRLVGTYVTIDTDTAVDRMRKRAQRTGRWVPETYMRETHANISRILPRAISDGLFDQVTVWDNNSATPFKIAEYVGGNLTILDEAAWEAFLAKGI
jgi:predicted ABC-type ATPase